MRVGGGMGGRARHPLPTPTAPCPPILQQPLSLTRTASPRTTTSSSTSSMSTSSCTTTVPPPAAAVPSQYHHQQQQYHHSTTTTTSMHYRDSSPPPPGSLVAMLIHGAVTASIRFIHSCPRRPSRQPFIPSCIPHRPCIPFRNSIRPVHSLVRASSSSAK